MADNVREFGIKTTVIGADEAQAAQAKLAQGQKDLKAAVQGAAAETAKATDATKAVSAASHEAQKAFQDVGQTVHFALNPSLNSAVALLTALRDRVFALPGIVLAAATGLAAFAAAWVAVANSVKKAEEALRSFNAAQTQQALGRVPIEQAVILAAEQRGVSITQEQAVTAARFLEGEIAGGAVTDVGAGAGALADIAKRQKGFPSTPLSGADLDRFRSGVVGLETGVASRSALARIAADRQARAASVRAMAIQEAATGGGVTTNLEQALKARGLSPEQATATARAIEGVSEAEFAAEILQSAGISDRRMTGGMSVDVDPRSLFGGAPEFVTARTGMRGGPMTGDIARVTGAEAREAILRIIDRALGDGSNFRETEAVRIIMNNTRITPQSRRSISNGQTAGRGQEP